MTNDNGERKEEKKGRKGITLEELKAQGKTPTFLPSTGGRQPLDLPALQQQAVEIQEITERPEIVADVQQAAVLQELSTRPLPELQNLLTLALAPPVGPERPDILERHKRQRKDVVRFLELLSEPTLREIVQGKLFTPQEMTQLPPQDANMLINLGLISEDVARRLQTEELVEKLGEGFIWQKRERPEELKKPLDIFEALKRGPAELLKLAGEVFEAPSVLPGAIFETVKGKQPIEAFIEEREHIRELRLHGRTIMTERWNDTIFNHLQAVVGVIEDVFTPGELFKVSDPRTMIETVKEDYAAIPERFKDRLRGELPTHALLWLDPAMAAFGAPAIRGGLQHLAKLQTAREMAKVAKVAEKEFLAKQAAEFEKELVKIDQTFLQRTISADDVILERFGEPGAMLNFLGQRREAMTLASRSLDKGADYLESFARLVKPRLTYDPKNVIDQSKLLYSVKGVQAKNAVEAAVDRLRAMDVPFEFERVGRLRKQTDIIKNVTPKKPQYSLDYQSIIEFGPARYNLSVDQLAYFKVARDIKEGFRNYYLEVTGETLPTTKLLPGQEWWPRSVVGFPDDVSNFGSAFSQSLLGRGQPVLKKPRHFTDPADAIKAAYTYTKDLPSTLRTLGLQLTKAAHDKLILDRLKESGIIRAIGEVPKALRIELASARNRVEKLKNVVEVSRRAARGEIVPAQTIISIRRVFPDLADMIEEGVAINRAQLDKILKGLPAEAKRIGGEFGRTVEFNPVKFRDALRRVTPEDEIGRRTIQMKHVNEAVRQLHADIRIGQKLVNKIQVNSVRFRSAQQKSILNRAATRAEELLPAARTAFNTVKAEAKRAKQLAGPTHIEAWLRQPGLRNFIALEKDAKFINEIGANANAVIRPLASVAGAMRTLGAGMDIATFLIQGWPMLFINPAVFFKATENMFIAFFHPKSHIRYLNRPENVRARIEMIQNNMTFDTMEYFEALHRSGLLNVPRRLPTPVGDLYGTFMNQTWGRGEAAFLAELNTLKIEAWKALAPIYRPQGQLRELSEFLTNITATLSTEAMGISATQVAIEGTFSMFSSRLTRAVITIHIAAFRGGISGELARMALARLWVGSTALHILAASALGQKVNLDPRQGNFMTVEINGVNVGPAWPQRFIIRAVGEITQTMMEDPKAFLSLERRDNALFREITKRFAGAPLGSILVDVLSGETFLGEKLEDPVDYFELLGSHGIPFSLEGLAFPPEGRERDPLFSVPIQFLGLAAWPKTLWQEVRTLREQLAGEKFFDDAGNPKAWEDLTAEEQNRVRIENNELPRMEDEARKAGALTADEEDKLLSEYFDEGRKIRMQYEDYLWDLQNDVDNGIKTPKQYRFDSDAAGFSQGQAYQHRDDQDRFANVQEILDKRTDLKFDEDIAYVEYIQTIVAFDFTDVDSTIFDHDLYQRTIAAFRTKWGEDIWGSVQRRLSQGRMGVGEEGRRGLPPLSITLHVGRAILRPYWEMRKQILIEAGVSPFTGIPIAEYQDQIANLELSNPMEASRLRRDPLYKRTQARIKRERERMFRDNPDMADFWGAFYQ